MWVDWETGEFLNFVGGEFSQPNRSILWERMRRFRTKFQDRAPAADDVVVLRAVRADGREQKVFSVTSVSVFPVSPACNGCGKTDCVSKAFDSSAGPAIVPLSIL